MFFSAGGYLPSSRSASNTRSRLAVVLRAALFAAQYHASAASAIPDGSTVLIDRPSGFGALPFDGVGVASVGAYTVSADGRFVVFSSNNNILLDNDDDGFSNVYRVDLQTHPRVVSLVSQTKLGSAADGNSDSPTISADGRYVAFSSTAPNLIGNAPARAVVVKDMITGDVELASRGDDPGDDGPSRGAFEPVISGDGRSVGFEGLGALSAANADAPEGTDDNAFVRHLDSPAHTYLLSVKGGSAAGNVRGAVVPSSTAPPRRSRRS